MKGKYLILIFILVIISVGTLIVLSIAWAEKQEIKKVDISGNQILGEQEIMSKLSGELLDNSNSKIKIENIQKLLKKNPYIQETYITHKNLNEIKVEVRERNPVAALVLENGNLVYIDAELNLLPYQLHSNMPDVPIISGIFANGKIDTTGIVGSFLIINNISAAGKAYLLPLIAEIDYSKADKTFSLTTSEDGAKVLLGKIDNIELKMEKLDAFYKNTLVSSGKSLKYLDLRWGDHVLAAS